MYYYNTEPTELETLLVDFLQYRKTRRTEAAAVQSTSTKTEQTNAPDIPPEIGKGWPHYKGYAASLQNSVQSDNDKDLPNSVVAVMNYTPITPPADMPVQRAPQAMPAKLPPVPCATSNRSNTIGYSAPERHTHKEDDYDYAHQLLGDISSSLMSHVNIVINNQEYIGSPIYEGHLQKDELYKMVEHTIELATEHCPNIAEIMRSCCGCRPARVQLLRAVAESLIIGEIYFRRRPIYRKLIDCGWNPKAEH